jgi:hypothetical protein
VGGAVRVFQHQQIGILCVLILCVLILCVLILCVLILCVLILCVLILCVLILCVLSRTKSSVRKAIDAIKRGTVRKRLSVWTRVNYYSYFRASRLLT